MNIIDPAIEVDGGWMTAVNYKGKVNFYADKKEDSDKAAKGFVEMLVKTGALTNTSSMVH